MDFISWVNSGYFRNHTFAAYDPDPFARSLPPIGARAILSYSMIDILEESTRSHYCLYLFLEYSLRSYNKMEFFDKTVVSGRPRLKTVDYTGQTCLRFCVPPPVRHRFSTNSVTNAAESTLSNTGYVCNIQGEQTFGVTQRSSRSRLEGDIHTPLVETNLRSNLPNFGQNSRMFH